MELEIILKRLKMLHDEGQNVQKTVEIRCNGNATPLSVDNGKFIKWQSKSIIFLEKILDANDVRLKNFKEKVDINHQYKVNEGLGILKSIIEDINECFFDLKTDATIDNTNSPIEKILTNFHRVVRQLRVRHNARQTMEINDEYDVQDLLHAILLIHFDDVRKEEWTPSYAGGSSRMDFLINDENIVIETKMTRKTLKDKKIADELINDIDRYAIHQKCEKMYCFVYDPQSYIKNPYGLENDLSCDKNGLEVKLIITPKF